MSSMRGSECRFSQKKLCLTKTTAPTRDVEYLDGPFAEPLDRLVDATEGSEGSGEVDMEDEFRGRATSGTSG